MTVRGSSTIRVLVTSLGLILIVLGLVMLVVDAVSGKPSRGALGDSLYDLLTSPWMDQIVVLDDLAGWLRHPRELRFLNGPITYLLDLVPQSIALIVVGAVIVWKGLKS